MSTEDKYINVTLPFKKDEIDFRTRCGVPFCFKEESDKTSIVEDIIVSVVKEYSLELGNISITTNKNNDMCGIEYQINLNDDADTIGSCIERIKKEIKSALIIFKK